MIEFKYHFMYLPTGERFNKKIECLNKLDLLEKINKFNMTSLINMSGKPFWIYWVE